MNTDSLHIRPARYEDAEILWRWANDPSVRSASFRPEAIPFKDHTRWFQGKLADSENLIWIAENAKLPVGQIRYDRCGPEKAEIDLSVAPGWRNRGIGSWMLTHTADKVCAKWCVNKLIGVVLITNDGSVGAFTAAGYQRQKVQKVMGKDCFILVRKCSNRKSDVKLEPSHA